MELCSKLASLLVIFGLEPRLWTLTTCDPWPLDSGLCWSDTISKPKAVNHISIYKFPLISIWLYDMTNCWLIWVNKFNIGIDQESWKFKFSQEIVPRYFTQEIVHFRLRKEWEYDLVLFYFEASGRGRPRIKQMFLKIKYNKSSYTIPAYNSTLGSNWRLYLGMV